MPGPEQAARRRAEWGLSHRVRTPEAVWFEYELAGLATRFVAWTIDLALILALVLVYMFGALMLMFSFGLGEALLFPLLAGSLLIFEGYHIFYEYRNGATPGKRMLGIQVLSADGLPIDLSQAAIRNVVRILDWLSPVYVIGGLVAFAAPRNQRLGDLAAGTIVVRRRAAVRPSQVLASNERYNTLLEDPMLRTRVRRGLKTAEQEMLVALCLRRNDLDLDERMDLFARAAAELRVRFELPRDERLSDERLVLNVAAILLGAGALRPSA